MEKFIEYKKVLSEGITLLLDIVDSDKSFIGYSKPMEFSKERNLLELHFPLSFYSNREQFFLFPSDKEVFCTSLDYFVNLLNYNYNICHKISCYEVLAEIFKCDVNSDYFVDLYTKGINDDLFPLLDRVVSLRKILYDIQEKLESLGDLLLSSRYLSFVDQWNKLLALIEEKIQQLITSLADLKNSTIVEKKISQKKCLVNKSLVFKRNIKFNYANAENLLLLLQQDGFISEETSIHDFCVIFQIIDYGLKGQEYNAKPIVWIKKSARVNNNKINRLALIDLLLLLGYNTHDIIGEEGNKYKRLNNCFKAGDRPFKANDFTNYFSGNSHELNVNSEYHDILLGLLKQAGIDVNFH